MHRWPLFLPIVAAAVLATAAFMALGPVLAAVCGVALIGAVIAAVHHAEVIAHRVGEPFGTLVLALAITAIEAALIISVMMAGGPGPSELARDTMFATLMIICNGVVGLCLLVGGLRHGEQSFEVQGAGPALAALVAMAALVLVLPTFTTTTPGPTYSTSQLAFVACASAALWTVFVFFQTVKHRDFFLPKTNPGDHEVHAEPPTAARAWASFALLLVALVSVVGLAKTLSPGIEAMVKAAGAPEAVIGIAIAILVLMPESWAALRAAMANRLQTSLNLALGSALASIGLTIPAVVIASRVLDVPLALGLGAKELVLLAVSLLVSTIALGTGRTNMMQGAVQLVVFAAFLFLALVP